MKKSFLLLCIALVATVTQAHTMDRAACHAQKKCNAQTQTVTDSILNAPHKYHEHYYERLQLFDHQPTIQCTDIVMLGNSLTEGGGDWSQRLGKNNIVNRGISGDIAMGIYDRLYQILPYHPAKIFLLVGVNDVSHDLSTDSIVHMIQTVITAIRTQSPQTQLYVQSMLPIREATGRWKRLIGKTQQIPEINAKIEVWTAEHGIPYINLFPYFKETDTAIMRAELTYDGLHLTEAGYAIWTQLLKKFL